MTWKPWTLDDAAAALKASGYVPTGGEKLEAKLREKRLNEKALERAQEAYFEDYLMASLKNRNAADKRAKTKTAEFHKIYGMTLPKNVPEPKEHEEPKVGDLYIYTGVNGGLFTNGKAYLIKDFRGSKDLYVVIEKDDQERAHSWSRNEFFKCFRKAEAADGPQPHQFKVGDIVECINTDAYNHLLLGQTYVVDGVSKSGGCVHIADIKTGKSLGSWCYDRFIKAKIPAPEQAEDTEVIKAGDWVECIVEGQDSGKAVVKGRVYRIEAADLAPGLLMARDMLTNCPAPHCAGRFRKLTSNDGYYAHNKKVVRFAFEDSRPISDKVKVKTPEGRVAFGQFKTATLDHNGWDGVEPTAPVTQDSWQSTANVIGCEDTVNWRESLIIRCS